MRTPIAVALTAVLAVGAWSGPAPARAAEPVRSAAYEDRLNGALQKMLDAVVGPGHAVATTAVELDLDRVETVSRSYSRDPSVDALSQTSHWTSYTDAAGTRYESTDVVRDNALNEVYETRITAPGQVKRLSVAVVVDRAVDVARLRDLISAAAGADPARGDTVVVSVMAARTGTDVSAGSTPPAAAATPVAGWQTVLAALALVLLAVVLAAARRRRNRAPAVPERPLWVPASPVTPAVSVFTGPVRPAALAVSASTGPVRPALDDPRRTAALLRDWVDPPG